MRREPFKARFGVSFLLQLDFITTVMKSHPNCPQVMSQWSNTWPDVVEQAKENKNFVIILPLIFFSAACRAQKTAEQGFDGNKWTNLDWLQVDMEIYWFKLHILCVSIRSQWEVVSHWVYLYMIKLHAKPVDSFIAHQNLSRLTLTNWPKIQTAGIFLNSSENFKLIWLAKTVKSDIQRGFSNVFAHSLQMTLESLI